MDQIEVSSEQEVKPDTDLDLVPINTNFISIKVIAAAVFGVLVVAGLFIYQLNSRALAPSSTPTRVGNTETPRPTPYPYPQPDSKKIYLMGNEGGGWTEIADFNKLDAKQVSKYKNLLFYADKVGSEIIIYVLNLENGTRQKFFSLDDESKIINEIDVIGNEIYFTTGGYMTMGSAYWAPLDPLGEPKFLALARNGRITNFAGHDWLLSSEGDGCGGIVDYNLLDFKTKKVTKIATSNMGCIKGEEMIGIDKSDRMILAYHKNKTEEDFGDLLYTSVVAVRLSDPKVKEGVIDLATMPTNTKSINYVETTNSLVMLGDKISVFDLGKNQLTSQFALPTQWTYVNITNVDDKNVCLVQGNGSENTNYHKLDLGSGTITEAKKNCEMASNTADEVTAETKMQEMSDLLNLPEKYKLEYK